MTFEKLSVVMPVRNAWPYLGQSIESILGQSFGDFEFIIGDDGSNDGSGEILADYARRDSRIRLLRREQGSGPSRSAAWVVAESRGSLVARMDADDVAVPDRLARQVAALSADPSIAMVTSLWEGIDEAGRLVRPRDRWRLVRRSPLAPFPHTSILFRRAFFDRAGGYRPQAEYWEDLDLYYRMADLGRVVILCDALVRVRQTLGSARLREDQWKLENAIDLAYRAIERYRRGEGYDDLLAMGPDQSPSHRLHPRTFVTCGATRLWAGGSPAVLGRMLRRSRIRLDLDGVKAFGWAIWGSLSPRTERWFLRILLSLRDLAAASALGGRGQVDWQPRDEDVQRRPASSKAVKPPVDAEPVAFS